MSNELRDQIKRALQRRLGEELVPDYYDTDEELESAIDYYEGMFSGEGYTVDEIPQRFEELVSAPNGHWEDITIRGLKALLDQYIERGLGDLPVHLVNMDGETLEMDPAPRFDPDNQRFVIDVL